MLVWCAGAYASGSTWAFNVARRLAECSAPVATRFINGCEDAQGLGSGRHVVKTHDVAPEVADVLATRATAILVTLRDPRDGVTSLMRYQNFPFEIALDWVRRSARFVAGLAHRPGVLSLRYEDGFVDLPVTVGRLAAHLGVDADAAARAAIFAALRRPAVEAQIARFPVRPELQSDPRSGDITDPVTQWHRHHAGRDGAIGRWRRTLTRAQAEQVRQALADLPALFHPRPLSPGRLGR